LVGWAELKIIKIYNLQIQVSKFFEIKVKRIKHKLVFKKMRSFKRLVSRLTSRSLTDLEVVHELLPVAVLHRVGAQLGQKGRRKRTPCTNQREEGCTSDVGPINYNLAHH